MNIIEIKNLSKQYTITRRGGSYVTLRDVLGGAFSNPFRFAKDQAQKIASRRHNEEFWALKDINLDIKKGEIIGIIGRNGAGKSTLLKILSRITPPTEGEAVLMGKVSSLLEVGTGFHPELTGRENVYLNGSILGMTRKEIESKFDDIVEFAGIGQFLYTPVKRYSSGMGVRLAFSIAAHLEPDILIVDEVLAIGDAEFQRKSLGKMHEVTAKEGRTILFVSHNMDAIRKLCTRTVLLDNGRIKMIGDTNKVVDYYLNMVTPSSSELSIGDITEKRKGNKRIFITDVSFRDGSGNKVESFRSGQNTQMWFNYIANDAFVKDFDFTLNIDSFINQERLCTVSTKVTGKKIKAEPRGIVKVVIDKLPLNVGRYYVTILVETLEEKLDWVWGAFVINVVRGDYYETGELPAEEDGSLLLNYEIT